MTTAGIFVGRAEAALFASDMHLDAGRPELTGRFLEELDRGLAEAGALGEAPALFLLGDLFEYWIGDDDLTAPAVAVAERLAAHAANGTRIWLMRGNRDFLVDTPLPDDPARQLRFSARCGATLLSEPAVAQIGGQRVGLCHGDELCTDDTRYQQWRTLCRSPAWQQALLAKPVPQRTALALAMREQSRMNQQATQTTGTTAGTTAGTTDRATPGDVSQVAVDALMTSLDVALLVHGHTHRPALHRWTADRAPRMRGVLSDWETAPARGSVRSLAEGLGEPATPAVGAAGHG